MPQGFRELVWVAGVEQIKLKKCPLCGLSTQGSPGVVKVKVVGDEQRIYCRNCNIEVAVKEVAELA